MTQPDRAPAQPNLPAEPHPSQDSHGEDSHCKSSKTVVNTASFHQPVTPPGTPRPSDSGSKSTPSALSASSASRFEIRKVLGSGGFGTVSLAWDSTLEREVAIKRPAPQLDEEHKRSFLAEARMAAKIKHPGIVVVHDVGTDESGDPFVVYEFLPGATLKQRLTTQPLSLKESLEMAVLLADALAAAHQFGVTHRDLKPANILLDEQGRPHIADFGLATEHEHQGNLRGQVAGTYRYMSPEQVRGEAHHLDGRTDLWSLGIICYEMLTGKVPFTSDENTDLFDQILHREPRPLRQWSKHIPREVEAIVLKLLSKPVTQRYSSASDVADDLRRCLADLQGAETTLTAPPPVMAAQPVGNQSAQPVGNQSAQSVDNTVARPTRVYLFPAVAVLGLIPLALAIFFWRQWFPLQVPSIPVPLNGSVAVVESAELNQNFPQGVWTNLLKREPLPLIMTASDRQAWTPNDLLVAAEFPTLLQLGETAAREYSLRIIIQEGAWDADGGMFLGFSAQPTNPQADQVVLLSVAKQENDQLTLHVRKVEFQRQGVQHPQMLEQIANIPTGFPRPPSGRVTLQVDVKNGAIRSCFIDSLPVALSKPDLEAFTQLSTRGKFGVFVFGKTCRFSNAEIRVNE